MKATTAPPKTTEEVQQPTTWIARVNLGRQMRDAGEKMIADALRERLDKVGEGRWLKECESEWGWSRTTAYRHLNPELLQKDRDRQGALRSDARNIELRPLDEIAGCEPKDKRFTRKSSNEDASHNQTGNGRPSPALPLPSPKGKCCTTQYRDGKMRHRADCSREDHRRERLDAGVASMSAVIGDMEENGDLLNAKKIETLSEIWDRLGAVIEQWGHGGTIPSDARETNAELDAVDGVS